MITRTSKKAVTFARPFTLKSVDEAMPAGTYTVETEEVSLDTMSFLAWRRVSTLLLLHGKPGSAVRTRMLTVDPNELDAALKRDRTAAGPLAGGNVPKENPATKQRQEARDRQAIERGEDEGMMIHPD